MPEVKVPGVGPVEKKYVIGGAGIVAGIGVYAWWKRSKANQAATDPNAIDPATGLPYSAEAGQTAGYVNPNPVSSVIDTTGNTITTNAQWTQAVLDSLGALMDSTFVLNTIGKYLARQPLTLDEAALIRSAWALKGKPPEGPDSFTLVGGSSTPGTGGGGSTSPTPGPAPAPAPAWQPPPTQRPGSSGDLVRQIQVALKAYGFDPGPIDGKYGPRTTAAVKSFQRSRGLSVDGIVGPQTWRALHG